MILHTEVTIVINNSIFHSISWTNSDNGVGLQIHQPNRVTSARGKMPGIPSGIFTKGCTSWNAGGGRGFFGRTINPGIRQGLGFSIFATPTATRGMQ